MPIEEHHLQAKIAATSQYFSQFKRRRSYFCPDYHRFEAYVRGLDSPSHYAEAFELIQLSIPTRIDRARAIEEFCEKGEPDFATTSAKEVS